VFFAYVDESGNSGTVTRGGSRTYTLGCVLLEASRWPNTFDRLIGFRRFLRARFGVPVRAELKANYLIHNGGPFRGLGLGDQARSDIYRQAIRLQPKLGLLTYAIVIDKQRLEAREDTRSPRDIAWEYLLQRLERFNAPEGSHPGHPVMLVHDEGEGAIVRKLARKARRAGTAGSVFGTGMLKRPATLLLDDPVSRDSRQSYFLQMADLNAYAAFRCIQPAAVRRVNIPPPGLWFQLGDAIYKPANYLAGGPPGIVEWPRS
jgi:Protein of unknown function (DUF3800)